MGTVQRLALGLLVVATSLWPSALAATEVLDLQPERLVFHYLISGETVACAREAKALDAARERIALVADQIRGGEFSANPKRNVCDYCDFKALCPAHEQLVS